MGNLDQAFLDTALVTIIERTHRLGPYENQLGGEACWHVLTVEPQHESIAAAHLAGRGFGVYLPGFKAPPKRWGGKAMFKPMFPGYIFLFCWAIQSNWRRIHACVGVTGVLMAGEAPAVLPDEAISIIQAQEILHDMQTFPDKKPKRRWRKTRNPQAKPQADTVHVSMTTYSALQCLISLDDAGRVGALRKALGLVSL